MAVESWRSFFNQDYIPFSQVIQHEQQTRTEVERIIELLQLAPGSRILDLGCGYGRISLPLAERGYEVTGVDGSEDMIHYARRHAEESGVKVNYIHQDMQGLSYEGCFDAVINIGTAFGYVLDELEDEAAMRNLYRALKPGGSFIQDTENKEFKLKFSASKTWDSMHGKTVWSERKFDLVTGRWKETIDWLEEGAVRRTLLDVRLYSATELLRMTRGVGFQVLGVYGGMDLSPLDVTSPRVVIHSMREDA